MKRRSFKGIIDIIDNGTPPKSDNPQSNKNKRKAEDGSGETQEEKGNDKAVKGQGKQNKKQNEGQPGQQLSKKARKAAARAAAASKV